MTPDSIKITMTDEGYEVKLRLPKGKSVTNSGYSERSVLIKADYFGRMIISDLIIHYLEDQNVY